MTRGLVWPISIALVVHGLILWKLLAMHRARKLKAQRRLVQRREEVLESNRKHWQAVRESQPNWKNQ